MPLVFNQEAINGILYVLHFQKDTPIVAHQKLTEIVGEEVMNLEQVIEFIKKIENGEFRLKVEEKPELMIWNNELLSEKEVEEVVVEGEQPKVTLAQILNVPDFVEKYLDIVTRHRLRKTCPTIREIVNAKSLHMDWLIYESNGNYIEISTNRGCYVSYETIEGGLRVKYCDRVRLINATNEEEQSEIVRVDLMSIFGCEKLRIGTFEIRNCRISYHEEPPMGMRALRNTFNQFPNKLKISNLDYWVCGVDEDLIVALKTIDLEHLKSLQLRIAPLFYDCSPIWKYLYDLEEWKRLKSVKVCYPGLLISDIINSYTHFENAHLKIRSFYDELHFTPLHTSIMMIKDKFIQNPNLKQFKLRVDDKMSGLEFEVITQRLQQYNTNNAPYPCWISIPFPDSDKKLEVLVKRKLIWFKGPSYVEEEKSSEEE